MLKPRLKSARAIHPNKGIEAAYKRRLLALIDEMTNSVTYWLKAQYRAAPPILAQDASPSKAMSAELNKLAKRWQKRFNDAADQIAKDFAKRGYKASNAAFAQALKDAGFTVEFKMTPAMRDVVNATIGENIDLIKSIPQKYLQKVQGSVLRGFTVGRDLSQTVAAINALYPKAADRAVLIARDQNNKLTASVTRTRRLELGITKAIWQHSAGGKTPRPSHVAYDGKEFDVDKGAYIDGEWIQPGELINCRCTSRSVLPA